MVSQQCSDYGGFVGVENEEGWRKGEVVIHYDCVDEDLPGCSYFHTKTSSQAEPSFFTRGNRIKTVYVLFTNIISKGAMVTGLMRKGIPTHKEHHHNQSALETSVLLTTPATPVPKKLSPPSLSTSLLPHIPDLITSRLPTLPSPSPRKETRSRDPPCANPLNVFYHLSLLTESPVNTDKW